MKLLVAIILFLPYAVPQNVPENAGTNVAPALIECYNTTRYVTRDFRLPATINVLIDLVRRIEDGNANQDAREISYEILQRFRQDGIRTARNKDTSQGLPYSPKGWEAYKNKIQLSTLTPGNLINFNNESLDALQACSLHFMVSSTIETQFREGETCAGFKQAYTSRIRKRQTEFSESDPQSRSQCPIESGVIHTKWGAVKAGIVIAGIASGLQRIAKKVDTANGPITLDAAYGSTLAGELAETALNQGSEKSVGNGGGWNSTLEPKYYFLTSNLKDNLYFTDAEIRGSLDGLFLALNIQNWNPGSIKISQVLDLYYGRGVFNNSARACNRKDLVKNIISSNTLVDQTTAFGVLLNDVSVLPYTVLQEKIPGISGDTVSKLRNYLNTNLQDVACSAEEDLVQRVATDVLIFVDTNWNYQVIHPFISNILENIDVNKFESSYTVFDGSNNNIIVNKTRSIVDFYELYNRTQQEKYPRGFDYVKVLQTSEKIYKSKLDNETDLTGQSMIILMLPHNSPTASEKSYVQNKRSDYKSVLPDLRIIVAGPSSRADYNDLVTNPTSDIITLSDGTAEENIKESARQVIARFKAVPRSVVNPQCKSSFSNDGALNFEVTQYVEPSAINYYKIAPNYFYGGQTLKVRTQGSAAALMVCTSRSEQNPNSKLNGTSSAKCQTVNANEYSENISSYCTDESVTGCSPIYLSVEGLVDPSSSSSSSRCTEDACRFPDSIKYSVSLESVHCSGSAAMLLATLLPVFLLFAILRF